jgi:hypothetical protein
MLRSALFWLLVFKLSFPSLHILVSGFPALLCSDLLCHGCFVCFLEFSEFLFLGLCGFCFLLCSTLPCFFHLFWSCLDLHFLVSVCSPLLCSALLCAPVGANFPRRAGLRRRQRRAEQSRAENPKMKIQNIKI